MDEPADAAESRGENAFESASADPQEEGLLREFWGYLRANKTWWLLPILLCLLLMAALIVLSGTAAAPFIYTLF